MKRARQNKILDLISRYEIDKQEELLRYLRESGFDVTQATVSRDIRELGLVKVSGGNGRYRQRALPLCQRGRRPLQRACARPL